MHSDTPIKSVVARRFAVADQQILYFAVEKSTTTVHQTSDGRCLQRKDLENRPVSAVQLQFERQEQLSREYDRQFVDGAQVLDLNLDVVRRVSDHITTRMSAEKCLQYLGLAEYGMGVLRLRRAALLLFAKEVSRWHPRCQVRVVRVRGIEVKTGREYNVTSDETATGNILELITAAWEKLRPHLVETKMGPDALFKENIMYPEDACREALINAITHRDYSIEGQNIEIRIFDDRMEVQSPGGLLSTIKVDSLRRLQGVHESRNALIAKVLREIGYVREMGEGMRRIYLLMQDADLVPPDLQAEANRFTITLVHKSVFSDTEQKWLDGYKPLQLTREEMLIALMGRNGNLLSPQQIYDRLQLVDWDNYRIIVDQVQTKGILYNTLTESEKIKRSRAKNVSKRDISRLAVRQPEDLELSLSELFASMQKVGPASQINSSYRAKILANLPSHNAYCGDSVHLAVFLKMLGLVDNSKQPTAKLLAIWEQSLSKSQVLSAQHTPASQSKSLPRQKLVQEPSKVKPVAVANRPTVSSSENPPAAKSIFVGNVDYDSTIDELREFFAQVGAVISISIPQDFVTERGRGIAFVEMTTQPEAEKAIEQLNGRLFRGRVLRLNWAH